MSQRKQLVIRISFTLLIAPFLAQAYETGPPQRVTGAPGDNKTACIEAGCHAGTLNSATTGGVKIILPNSATTFVPGQAMQVSVQVTDSAKVKYGFQLTARLASSTSSGQAGDFTTGSDGFTQVLCDDGSTKKNGSLCPAQFPVEFIEHTVNGYEASTKGGYTFTFTWTPPAAASAGNVILYAAGNAGPGDPPVPTPTNVYSSSVTLTPAAATSNAPAITPSGVVAHGSSSTTIEPGSWVDIYGTSLSQTSRFWNAATEIVNGNLPTSLDNVSVTINNKPAYVYFISPGQINVQAPDDTATGSVNVVVKNSAGTSTSVTATLATVGPTFFTLDGKYAAGVIPAAGGFYLPGTASSYDLLGISGQYAFNTRPVKKGEVLELYATGFGPGNPAVPAGHVYTSASQTIYPVTLNIGGLTQTINAYITGAGVYQMNVTIPSNVASGDNTLQAMVNNVLTPTGIFITVQ